MTSRRRPFRRAARRAACAAACCVALGLAACAGPALEPAGPTPAATPAPAAPAATAAALRFAWSGGARRLTLESRATVTVAGDTAEARDTVVTRLAATLRLPDTTGARRLTGTIDSVTVQSGARIPAVPPALPLPIPIEGVVVDGVVRLPPSPPNCASPAGPLLAAARELVPSIPSRLATGTRWSDTVTTTTCRGGVVLTTTAVHRYEVAGPGAATADGAPTVRVRRESALTVAGEGEQAREPVRVAGTGTGRAELLLGGDAVRGLTGAELGRLLRLDGESTLELLFTGAGREQRVVQRGTTTVRERPPAPAP